MLCRAMPVGRTPVRKHMGLYKEQWSRPFNFCTCPNFFCTSQYYNTLVYGEFIIYFQLYINCAKFAFHIIFRFVTLKLQLGVALYAFNKVHGLSQIGWF